MGLRTLDLPRDVECLDGFARVPPKTELSFVCLWKRTSQVFWVLASSIQTQCFQTDTQGDWWFCVSDLLGTGSSRKTQGQAFVCTFSFNDSSRRQVESSFLFVKLFFTDSFIEWRFKFLNLQDKVLIGKSAGNPLMLHKRKAKVRHLEC